jgi:hypothetical protein
MKLFKYSIPILLSLIVLLPACRQDQNDISVKVAELSRSEAKLLFEGRGRHLIVARDKIIPVRVIIENRGDYPITVKPATMAITDFQIIYERVAKNVAGISAASTIGGFLLAGPIGAAAFGAGFGISNAKKNDRISSKISQDAFIGAKEVHPHSTFNKIMFVKESDFQPTFSLPVGSYIHQVNLS